MLDKQTINSIQSLRGVAALFVVVLHAFVHLKARLIIPEVPDIVDSGRVGVDMFFVISGFIMVYISDNKFGQPGASVDFFIKRLIRVVPIYWFYTLIMAGFLFFLPNLFSHGKIFDTNNFIASMMFIPWENNLGGTKPVLQVGWTLNFEMYFYVIFATLLLFNKKYFLILMFMTLLLGIVAGSMIEKVPQMYVITSPLLLEFLMGCIVCVMFKNVKDLPSMASYLLILVGSIMIIMTGIVDVKDVGRVIKWGVPAALILTGCVFLEREGKVRNSKLLSMLGASSYSLYLSHIFTINALGKIWATFIGQYYVFFVFVAVISSVIVGYMSFVILEKSVTTYLNNQYYAYKQFRSMRAQSSD